MAELLARFNSDELRELVSFFWGLQRGDLSEEQIDRIFAFWGACMERITTGTADQRLLSELGLLAVYLEKLSLKEKDWLLTLTPAVAKSHNVMFFVKYLDQLAEKNAHAVGEITLKLLEGYTEHLDFEEHFASIVRKLSNADERTLALEICSGLANVPGFAELYDELV